MKLQKALYGTTTSALALAAGFAPPASADLTISETPLVVSSQVAPNVFFQLDDSGSMDMEILLDRYFHYCRYDPDALDGGDCPTEKQQGKWRADGRQYVYLFENGDNVYGSDCTNGGNSNLRDCSDSNRPSLGDYDEESDWRVRSPQANVTWFNPRFEYEPWPDRGDADFDNARSNPMESSNTKDLDGFVWYEWLDDKGYNGSEPDPNASSVTSDGNGEVDLWDSRIRFEINGNTIERTLVRSEFDQGELVHEEFQDPNVDTSDITDATEVEETKQNIANWYEYYRRRTFTARNAIADVIQRSPNFRYGITVLNKDNDLFVEVPEQIDGDFTSHNEDLRDDLYNFEQPSAGTPLRQGLQDVGEYYEGNRSGTDNPIVEACQKNFTIQFTDGFWGGGSPGVGDEDDDGASNTLADVARRYYQRDLSSLDDEVPPDDFHNDPMRQHMNTYTVGFGVSASLEDTDGDGWPNPELDVDDLWGGDPTASGARQGPYKVDDLWHAAWNSRGRFLQADTPQELIDGMRDALSDIRARTATSTAATTNSGSLQTDTKAYQARFDSSDWSGELLAYEINKDSNGDIVLNRVWEAGDEIDGPADRNLLTVEADGNNSVREDAINFEWGNLTNWQQDQLNTHNDGTNDGLGEERLEYIAGADTNEGQDPDDFRPRDTLLGDIVDSDPQFVHDENFGYEILPGTEGDTYRDFLTNTKQSRDPMLYVGANDGMLHGFNADTGEEAFGYVPGSVYGHLSALTDQNYDHRFYVNEAPSFGDAYMNGSWKTVLLGANGQGGRSVFALDVTNPSGMGTDDVLWEFSHPELGRTVGQPKVARLEGGNWVAIFGNGYNSDSHEAKLFIVDLEDPSDYWILEPDTQGDASDPNGLSEPAIVDDDGDRMVDTVYAGDLHGRMWKFDVSSSDPSDWGSAYGSDPLFAAEDDDNDAQPITTRPEVTFNDDGEDFVLFGTGKYIENSDATPGNDPRVESIYGIRDETGGEVERSQLKTQTIQSEETENGATYRIISQNGLDTNDEGWHLDLVFSGNNNGERVIFDPVLRGGRLIVNTLVPNDDPCSTGGIGWSYNLNPFSGERLQYNVFDVNNDSEFGTGDNVNGNTVSGQQNDYGTNPGSSFDAGDERYKVVSNPDGEPRVVEEPLGTLPIGRQLWRQLR